MILLLILIVTTIVRRHNNEAPAGASLSRWLALEQRFPQLPAP